MYFSGLKTLYKNIHISYFTQSTYPLPLFKERETHAFRSYKKMTGKSYKFLIFYFVKRLDEHKAIKPNIPINFFVSRENLHYYLVPSVFLLKQW